jgi:DNA processing protein
MYNYSDKLMSCLLLKSIKGISDKVIIKLMKNLDNIVDIFKKSETELKEFGLTYAQIESILSKKYDEQAVEKELSLIKEHKINIIFYDDEIYPALLREIEFPPAFLYCYGNLESIKRPSIAIVGSRKASIQAQNFTFKLAKDLGELGFNIVSGYASGIDIKAHLGSIEKGYTTCILGNGFLKLYPKENRKYLKDILERGCLLTEFPMNAEPDAHNFPRRNRIISGMSHGVIVIEAAAKSGSLITAKYAMEQNREVFAVPTFPDNFQNATNSLIKEGAILIENYKDVVENLVHIISSIKTVDKDANGNNIDFESDTQKRIFELLSIEAASADYLGMKLGLTISEILNELADLELSDIISLSGDGKYYLN